MHIHASAIRSYTHIVFYDAHMTIHNAGLWQRKIIWKKDAQLKYKLLVLSVLYWILYSYENKWVRSEKCQDCQNLSCAAYFNKIGMTKNKST